jgi:hypothetical protein
MRFTRGRRVEEKSASLPTAGGLGVLKEEELHLATRWR